MPKQHAPYVWIFNKEGTIVHKKSPSNLFHKNNFYTIKRADGKRDLTLEHGLNELETKFSSFRDRKLKFRQKLTAEEHIILCAFMASMHAQTKIMREAAKTTTPKEKKLMASPPRSAK